MISLASLPSKAAPGRGAFTLMEVLVSALLICLAMASIMPMNVSAAKILRTSRDAAASSQILQQRVEMIRERPWNEVASSAKMAALLQGPTESEAELQDANVIETMRVTVPKPTSQGLGETDRFFSVRREKGAITVQEPGNFTAEPTLLFEGTVTWRDGTLVHERALRTIICRVGLTRSGIVGTVLGRPGSQVGASK